MQVSFLCFEHLKKSENKADGWFKFPRGSIDV
jgi:hypothetical protein